MGRTSPLRGEDGNVWNRREAPAAENRLAAGSADQIASLKPFATRNATFLDALLALIRISSPVAGALFAVFSGIVTDPLQRLIGFHRRRLLRVIGEGS